MAKNLLKKAKKAVSSVKKHAQGKAEKIEKKAEKVISKSTASPEVLNIREHIAKLAHERRDCATMWTLIKNKEMNHEDVVKLIKAKGYETLLGEIS
jgi:hypothetical protein